MFAVEFITLDGFFEGLSREIDWLVHDDPEVAGNPLSSVDTILLGRTTYELMVGEFVRGGADRFLQRS
jgi:dihydrofolate reductase